MGFGNKIGRIEGYSSGSTSLTDEDIAYAESVGFKYEDYGFVWVGSN